MNLRPFISYCSKSKLCCHWVVFWNRLLISSAASDCTGIWVTDNTGFCLITLCFSLGIQCISLTDYASLPSATPCEWHEGIISLNYRFWRSIFSDAERRLRNQSYFKLCLILQHAIGHIFLFANVFFSMDFYILQIYHNQFTFNIFIVCFCICLSQKQWQTTKERTIISKDNWTNHWSAWVWEWYRTFLA